MEFVIDDSLPLGALGRLVDRLLVRPRLRRLFDYRHEVTLREVLAMRERNARPTRSA
jgi:hypothetical protein